jgi:hypothetical protein
MHSALSQLLMLSSGFVQVEDMLQTIDSFE